MVLFETLIQNDSLFSAMTAWPNQWPARKREEETTKAWKNYC